jgi:hypothetical protein
MSDFKLHHFIVMFKEQRFHWSIQMTHFQFKAGNYEKKIKKG